MMGIANPVIASEAKQSSATSKNWIASSHPPSPEAGLRRTRELLAMTGQAIPNQLKIIPLQITTSLSHLPPP
jgi:hypothetical protein